MGPPLELRLPPRSDGNDRHLQQTPFDRRLKPQGGPEVGEPAANAGCSDPGIERTYQGSGG